MSYWFGVGLLITSVGLLFFVGGKRVRRGVAEPLDGSAGAGIVLGYILPWMGALFMVVGLIEMFR